MLKTLTFATKNNTTKVHYEGVWFRTSGGGYNKEKYLLNLIFNNEQTRMDTLEQWSMCGWNFETVEVR